MIDVLAASLLGCVVAALAYAAAVERVYLHDQHAEIGDRSIGFWRSGFTAAAIGLAILSVLLLGWSAIRLVALAMLQQEVFFLLR